MWSNVCVCLRQLIICVCWCVCLSLLLLTAILFPFQVVKEEVDMDQFLLLQRGAELMEVLKAELAR